MKKTTTLLKNSEVFFLGSKNIILNKKKVKIKVKK